MKGTLYADVRDLLVDDGGRPIDEPASQVDEPAPQPSRRVRFYERATAASTSGSKDGTEIGLEQFLNRLRTAWNNQVLLYVHGVGGQAAVLRDTERLQEQCDHADPGLVQVVPLLWPAPHRRAETGGRNPDADTQPASAAPADADADTGVGAAGVGDVLRTLLNRRDARHPAKRKRISVLAHGVGVRVLRDALASWPDDAGPPYGAFSNVFLTAADVGWHALETGRSGRRLSDAARNVTVYYANDDWAFSSPVTRQQYPAATRRLGQAGPADLAAVAKNVYAVDCDDVYAVDRHDDRTRVATESDTSPYFLVGRRGAGTPDPAVSGDRDDRKMPGPLVKHLLHALRTGRVRADPATRTHVLDHAEKRGDR